MNSQCPEPSLTTHPRLRSFFSPTRRVGWGFSWLRWVILIRQFEGCERCWFFWDALRVDNHRKHLVYFLQRELLITHWVLIQDISLEFFDSLQYLCLEWGLLDQRDTTLLSATALASHNQFLPKCSSIVTFPFCKLNADTSSPRVPKIFSCYISVRSIPMSWVWIHSTR